MAEINPELDAINRLLEVEKEASALIADEKLEADKRIMDAKTKYNIEYKAKYKTAAVQMEREYVQRHDEVQAETKKAIEDYETTLENKPQNIKAFTDLLKKLLA